MSNLKTLTVGPANEATRGFSCNSSMYQAALEELEHRFERPHTIVNSFLDKLRTFKTPRFQNPTTLMDFSTFVNNFVEFFRLLGFKKGLNSTIYTQNVADKLSLNDHLRWNKFIVQNQ